jgi:hypothetical protein
MTKKFTFQLSMAILATCSAMLAKSQSASAQVDMSLLTEVAKSCQKDTNSSEYYKQMGFGKFQSAIGSDYSLKTCIYARYGHSLLQSKFPWLASTGEVIPGYPGSVAVSLMANQGNSSLLDCLASKDPSDARCISSIQFFNDYEIYHISDYDPNIPSTYVCPSCVVADVNMSSSMRMRESFIKWFLNLDKPTRRKVMSILGDDQEAINNRNEISTAANTAVHKYNKIREKVMREEQDRRRREVIGD